MLFRHGQTENLNISNQQFNKSTNQQINELTNHELTNHDSTNQRFNTSTFFLPLLIAVPEGFVFSGCFVAIDPAFIPKEIHNRDDDNR